LPTAVARRPALDGLRALALLGMLAWHAEIGWVRGGFARMTIFFVLSGFLATRSYLRVPLAEFWRRRARRLLPVTVLGLAAAVAVTVAVGTADMRASLRGDALSVVGYASNWRFLLAGRDYGALFERPSAFQHFWSLSLEEQCLLALPLVLLVARRWGGAVLTGALAVALGLVPAVVAHTPDAAYYGTHVRAGEFLVGATLALVLHRSGDAVPARWARPVQWAGALSLTVLAVVMVAVDRDQPWLYRGGLIVFAVPAVAVVAAALGDAGVVPRLLAARPLAALGRATFPVYVLHWPLFVLARHVDLPVSGTALVAAELVVAVAVGLAVHHLVEQPLPRWPDARVLGPAVAGLALVVALAALVPVPPPAYDFEAAERLANEGVVPVAGDDRPAVGLFGGSTAVSLGATAFGWAEERRPPVRIAPGSSQLGCGLVTEGRRLTGRSRGVPRYEPPDPWCAGWEQRWPAAADDGDLATAVILGGVWETTDWELGGRRTDLTDPGFAGYVLERMDHAVTVLGAGGRRVLLATTPLVRGGSSGTVLDDRGIGPDQARRVAVYNDLVHQVAAAHEQVRVLDYGALVDDLDDATAADWLPDGVHPTDAAAHTVWDVLIGPAVIGDPRTAQPS
jgi:peptidoglycan/LPS O-acetylase OafA/YrhL